MKIYNNIIAIYLYNAFLYVVSYPKSSPTNTPQICNSFNSAAMMPVEKVEIGDPFNVLGILAKGDSEIRVHLNFLVNHHSPYQHCRKNAGITTRFSETSKPLSSRICIASFFLGWLWRTKLCLEKPQLNLMHPSPLQASKPSKSTKYCNNNQ